MEDPKVPFADTTARRAQLLAATERYKSSIESGVKSLQSDAQEIGKTTAIVAGAALAVYLIANAILPKSAEYRYAEKFGEPDDDDDNDYDFEAYANENDAHEDDIDLKQANLNHPRARQKLNKKLDEQPKKSAIAGLVGGLVTSVLTNLARQQLTAFLERYRENNAAKQPAATSTVSYQQPTTSTAPVSYSEQL